jgi:hypothetical protein
VPARAPRRRVVRRAGLAATLGGLPILAAGCGESAPAVAHPGEVYRADDALYDRLAPTQGSRVGSRHVLYLDGSFALQFSSRRHGVFEYRGGCERAGPLVTFTFDGAGGGTRPARCTATLCVSSTT